MWARQLRPYAQQHRHQEQGGDRVPGPFDNRPVRAHRADPRPRLTDLDNLLTAPLPQQSTAVQPLPTIGVPMTSMRRFTVAGTACAAVLTLGGCATVEVAPPVENCSPSFVAPSKYGRFTIQQSGKNKAIQWGAYPNKSYSGTHYTAVVRADGRKIDSKSQNYAPHGSVGANRAKKYSGKILEISGQVTKGKKVALVYSMRCKIA